MTDKRALCGSAVAALVWLAACSQSAATPSPTPSPTPDASVEPSAGSGGSAGTAGATGTAGTNLVPLDMPDAAAPMSDCSSAASAFVYVLANNNQLYRFAPDKKTFAPIGTVACAPGQTPNSMAVDRSATAWVNYLDGTLHPVSTMDASCTGNAITLPSGWAQDGMAYVAASAGSALESLYLTGSYTSAGVGLGSVNIATGALRPIGQYGGTLQGASAELTGTGDGRLFGLFVIDPPTLAEIDRSTGAVLSQTPLSGLALSSSSSFAFSFWGGRFYFYTYPNLGSSSSNVTEYDPNTHSLNPSFMTDIGFTIVGAGVSTCAPVVPPPLK